MFRPRRALFALTIAGALVAGTGASFAVMSYLDAESWDTSTQDYKDGYAAGALDMLRALDDAKVLGGSFASQARSVVSCSNKSTAREVGAMYDGYMKREPKRRRNSTASAIYNAIRIHCGVN